MVTSILSVEIFQEKKPCGYRTLGLKPLLRWLTCETGATVQSQVHVFGNIDTKFN